MNRDLPPMRATDLPAPAPDARAFLSPAAVSLALVGAIIVVCIVGGLR